MNFTITNSRAKLEGITPDGIDEAIEQMLVGGKTSFFVEKSREEYLNVIYTDRGCAVIYTKSAPFYIALDASTEPAESAERVTLMVDNEPTPLPANMKLRKAQVREIIREFCASGQLSNSVHWVNDVPRA